MADGRHFENGFIAISQPEIMRLNEIWCADADCASKVGYLTKYQNFANSKLKIVFCLYLDE